MISKKVTSVRFSKLTHFAAHDLQAQHLDPTYEFGFLFQKDLPDGQEHSARLGQRRSQVQRTFFAVFVRQIVTAAARLLQFSREVEVRISVSNATERGGQRKRVLRACICVFSALVSVVDGDASCIPTVSASAFFARNTPTAKPNRRVFCSFAA